MSGRQSTLGEEGIAQELAESQRSISIAEFFEKNKHMLGFDSGARALVTAVKEGVDNSLDACEEADIMPDIYVEIEDLGDYFRLVVEDNGPGITKQQLPKVFGKLLYGSRFHKREQARGQQGIGISAAVLYAQLTSGKPVKITSRTQGSDHAQYFELIIDTDTNEPEVSVDETTTWDRPHGTRIEMEMEANLRARQQLRDYIQHTAVVNPHARIEFLEPNLSKPLKFERAEGAELPAETEEIRPHPHGVELGTLLKMLAATDSYTVSGFLQEEFTRVGGKTATKILDNFRDRHFGREMAWRPPQAHEGDIEVAVRAAVANKSKDATKSFARDVADRIDERDRIAHHEVRAIVDEVADDVAEGFTTTFGSTVREKATLAAWAEIVGDTDDGEPRETLSSDLYGLVSTATSSRKDDATIKGLADRIGAKFADSEDDRHCCTRSVLSDYVQRAAENTEEYDDATIGETARENVIEGIWGVMVTVPDELPTVAAVADDRDSASQLLEAMRETDIMSPPTDCLAPITEHLVEEGLRKEFDAEFYAAATRDAAVQGGDPFIVEAGIAYGGELEAEGTIDVMRFANRVPLVYQRGACATTDVVKSINWRNYGLDQPGGSGLPNGPAVVMVHVASTNVPFTSESKDAIANVPEIEDEIELAIREASRELKSFLNKRRSMRQRREKQDKLGTILPEMATKLSEVTGREALDIDDSMARIMNNVLVEREVENGTVRLVVENNDSVNATPEITDIVTAEPANVEAADDDPRVVEMDGEWFLTWEPTVKSGSEAAMTYEVDGEASFDVSVEGIDSEKLTVDGAQ